MADILDSPFHDWQMRRIGVWTAVLLLAAPSCTIGDSCRDSDVSCSLPAFLLFLRSITPRFAYVSNSGGTSFSIYSVDPGSGLLTPVATTSASPLGPYHLVLDPSQSFLYASGSVSNFVGTFAIDQTTGLLSSRGTIAGADSYGIAMSPDGRFVYTVLAGGNTIMIRARDSSTGLLSGSGSGAIGGTLARGLAIDPQGRWLFVSDQSAGTVRAYTIDSATGNVGANGFIAAGGTNVSFSTVDSGGRFVYAAAFAANLVVPVAVNQTTGTLSIPFGTLATAPDTSPYVPAMHPNGTFLYVIAQGTNALRTYSVNADGSLAFRGSTPTGATPSWVRVDPSGKFVYVVNAVASTVWSYKLDSSGLPVLSGSVPCGASANDIILTSAYQF